MTATFVLTLAKVHEMAQEVGVDGESELVECLQYLHNAGSVVFFDEAGLREHVVLNPQWLADAMAHVLNCPRVVQGNVAAARRLRERGELEDEFLRRHLWKLNKFRHNHEVLLRMLYRYDLIIPMMGVCGPSAASPVHVVPSLLPRAPAGGEEESSSFVSPTQLDSLYFDFHGLFAGYCRLSFLSL